MEIFGYVSALVVGLTLGLIGGGGSILTVPILVYIFKIPAITATSYSLFIVGLTSIFGLISYLKNGLINFRISILFSIPSFIGVFLSRRYIVPSIPQNIIQIGSFNLTKNTALLLLFSIVMILAAKSMIIKKKKPTNNIQDYNEKNEVLKILILGFLVGLLTGTIGAGGGFIIIPVLISFARLEMKEAIATSLLIISINSLLGFTSDLINGHKIIWIFIFKFLSFTISGVLFGTYISKFISGEKLKPIFGWFVLLMGAFILIKEGFIR